jgi:hypothetical protein
MASPQHIQYVTNDQIDRLRWDQCIDTVSNGLVYGYSWYLDHMATHWDALVLGDYVAVMPLTWNKKYSIRYLYQPFCTALLGVFGNGVDASILQQFLEHIPAGFRFWDIYLNHGNLFTVNGFSLYERANYVLTLAEPYEKLQAEYRENIRRNIKKAVKAGILAKKEVPIDDVIGLAKLKLNKSTHTTDEDFVRFKKLYDFLHAKGAAITYGMYSPAGELLSSCVFFFSHNRAYYILVGNHPYGKTSGSSHALIDAFIRDHAGQPLLLDFEGSDIPSLAFFYSGFGSQLEKYPGIRLNRLPWLLRWLKG